MADFINIPATLNVPTQAPLNKAQYSSSESTLSSTNAGTAPYAYYKQMVVTTFLEGTSWVWRPVEPGEENTGLLSSGDFTYPSDVEYYGIIYSNQKYNFFPILQNGTNGTNGTNGADGTDGTDGTKWYTSSAIPSNTIGNDGDFAINENRPNQVWIKTAGVWGIYISSLEGQPGEDASMNLQKQILSGTYDLLPEDNNYTLLVDGPCTIRVNNVILPNSFNVGFIQTAGTPGSVVFVPYGVNIYSSLTGATKIRKIYDNAYLERNELVPASFYLLGNVSL